MGTNYKKQIIEELVEKGVFDVLGDAVSIQDTQYKILYQNAAAKKMIDDHKGEFCYKAYEGRDDICEHCPLTLSFKDGEVHTGERVNPLKERELIVQITSSAIKVQTGEIIAGIEVVRDVTNRRKAEKTLEEKEKFLNDVFDSIQNGISILDKDLNIVRVNKTMERWYSHAMPLTGKKCYKAYHGANESCAICPSKETFKSGKAAYELVPKRDSKGEIVGWLDLYSFPMIDNETKELQGIIEYVHDVTERKKMESELNQRIEELNQFYDMSVTRELKMKDIKNKMGDLKLQIKELQSELSKYKQ
jgi:PAS domain S-box-containing protein